ncbi:MAG TPA: hypothetical protein VG963_23855, partial [Polyangiaceae bacterium]|nr:hypothetical protein [Polyangiaceae bacterium]
MSSLSTPAVDGARDTNRINVTQNIKVEGAGKDAEEIGRISAREARRELEAFFRQLSMES